jgi:hypothetical protein
MDTNIHIKTRFEAALSFINNQGCYGRDCGVDCPLSAFCATIQAVREGTYIAFDVDGITTAREYLASAEAQHYHNELLRSTDKPLVFETKPTLASILNSTLEQYQNILEVPLQTEALKALKAILVKTTIVAIKEWAIKGGEL